MTDNNGKIDREAFDRMDKLFGGMFSEQLGGFDEMMKKFKEECKHSPDLTKMPVVCGRCGVRMKLDG